MTKKLGQILGKLKFAYLVVAIIMALPVTAYSIGFDHAIGWGGSAIYVINSGPIAMAHDRNVSPGGIAGPSSIDYQRQFTADEGTVELGGVEAMGDADYYEIHGSISHYYDESVLDDGEEHSLDFPDWYQADEPWTLSEYFRDELFLETADGLGADISLQFYVDAHLENFGGSDASSGTFSLTGKYVNDIDSTPMRMSTFGEFSTEETVSHQLVTMTLTGLESGTYLPFSIIAKANVKNGQIDFTHTVILADVLVTRNGVALDPSLYTMTVGSGDSRFPSNQMSPVPEPATLILMGTGLVGLFSLRKRM